VSSASLRNPALARNLRSAPAAVRSLRAHFPRQRFVAPLPRWGKCAAAGSPRPACVRRAKWPPFSAKNRRHVSASATWAASRQTAGRSSSRLSADATRAARGSVGLPRRAFPGGNARLSCPDLGHFSDRRAAPACSTRATSRSSRGGSKAPSWTDSAPSQRRPSRAGITTPRSAPKDSRRAACLTSAREISSTGGTPLSIANKSR